MISLIFGDEFSTIEQDDDAAIMISMKHALVQFGNRIFFNSHRNVQKTKIDSIC